MAITDAKFVQGYIRLADAGAKRGWHERNGGNFSYRLRPEEVEEVKPALKPAVEWLPIGNSVPDVAGEYFLVTGTGKYMSNVALCPEDNIAIIKVDDKGEKYSILWGYEHGGRPTSELPTHLMNHGIKKIITNGQNRVIYHAHPANAIALTFVLPLTAKAFSHELWEMMTEVPIIFPEGIGVVPWMVPGGKAIADVTGDLMKKYNAVIWAHHGVFCAGKDFDEAFGFMDTIEKASSIFVKVHAMGGKKQTITNDNFHDLGKAFNVELNEEFLH